jgi:hypothetical protein
MHVSRCVMVILVSLTFLALVQSTTTSSTSPIARDIHKGLQGKHLPEIRDVLVLDGSNVHNVGQLWMHIGNWGLFGSMPGAAFPFSSAPSAEWPGGSGVEYLYAAGLWVGAVKDGVPAVSTSLYQFEFRPTQDPIDIIYRSYEGAPGGNRLPNPNADDDHDGKIDEDWLNGRDDDGDGKIDEDFAGISDQMFSCWYTDDQPGITQIYPEHNPLHILVRQESYQWRDDRFNDFVGVHFIVENIGTDLLNDVYIGIFADIDAGPRNLPNYWEDDGAGFFRPYPACTDIGPADVEIAYGYDVDGDGGRTPGYFGILLLDHTTDPLGLKAPRHPEVCTYASFAGDQPFEQGGDPTNDFERYELLSQRTIERDRSAPQDYRTLMAVGPFKSLAPGESLTFRIAFVVGPGLQGMVQNAALAKRFYDGTWFDIDKNPMTGVDRRETPVHGPAQNVVIDACRPELSTPIPFVPEGSTVWVNNDCEMEDVFKTECRYAEADSAIFRTGVGGREHQINWYLGGQNIHAWLDVQPGTCPNRLVVNPGRSGSGKNDDSMAGGVLHVALLGKPDFHVRDVDLASIRLEGVQPVKEPAYRDVGTEPMRDRACVCPGEEPDGNLDLVLKFPQRDVLAALQPVSDGDERIVTMTGRMTDGREFDAVDCVLIDVVGAAGKPDKIEAAVGSRADLRAILPNPFNPATRITYYLPQEAYVTLEVYDVAGRLVDQLVARVEDAGEHVVEWDASRSSSISSGIYFCRLVSGGVVETRKLVVMK